MLRVWFGHKKSAFYSSSTFFKNQKLPSWFDDKIVKKMIKDVDESIVMSPYSIKSPVLGNISPDDLSGGVKTLILMYYFPNKIFNASNCGDNCIKWILKLGDIQDFTINLYHVMNFGKNFKLKVLNGRSGKIIDNMDDFIKAADRYLR